MSEEKFQDAMKKRLAKLSSMPVDMSAVERGVKARLFGAQLGQNEVVLGHKGAEISPSLGTNIQGLEAVSAEQNAPNLDPITGKFVPNFDPKAGRSVPNSDPIVGKKVPDSYPKSREMRPDFARRTPRFWRPLAAAAAGLVLVAIVGIALLQGRPAQASDMVQLHRDIVSGKVHTMPVDSVAEVNEAFAAFGKDNGGMKIEAPQMAVMSCCMQQVGSRQVYCVLLKEEGVPVTLTIADAGAIEALRSPAVMYKGAEYHVEAHGDLTMVTTERGGRRVCLIGALAAERLMGLAEGLKL